MVIGDAMADGVTPAVGTEGFDIFALGDADGLQENLHEEGDGAGGFGFDLAAENGGDEASGGGRDVAGGEVVGGEEVGEVVGERFGGLSTSVLAGVVVTEAGMAGEAWSAAAAAVGEGELTTIFGAESRHESLL